MPHSVPAQAGPVQVAAAAAATAYKGNNEARPPDTGRPAGCDKRKNSTVHHPSSHHSRMAGGTRLPQTSFTPPLWTGDRALDSHPSRGWDRTAPGRW